MAEELQTSAQYDEMFIVGGFSGVYDLPTNKSWYYPLYKRVLKELASCPRPDPVLEVGCGTGGLAALLLNEGYSYMGFDFSEVAIAKAIERTSRPECFWVGDALDRSNYNVEYKTIICTEVLEHIPNDLEMIDLWNSESRCICSVPNFDSPFHVRFFGSSADVRKRYGHSISVLKIKKVKKPALPDISFRNYCRHLVWNRYRPLRCFELLGLRSFEAMGGWFVFVEKKR